MKETSLWKYLKDGLKKAGGHSIVLQRHEDLSGVGIADVSFSMVRDEIEGIFKFNRHVNGWIELKSLDAWPKRPDTPVRIKHLTKEQCAWLDARACLGGHTWLLLRVGRDYLLLNGINAKYINGLTKTDVINIATKHWQKSIDFQELLGIL